MDPIKTIEGIIKQRSLLIGRMFRELSPEERQVLYASDLYDDCKDLKIVAESVLGAHRNFVDTQLRVAFMYEDETTIL
jgi:hypothetical protein